MSKRKTSGLKNQHTPSPTEGTDTTVSSVDFKYDIEVKALLSDLKKRKRMEVKTSTLYDKYEEVKSTYTMDDYDFLCSLSNELWKPTNMMDLDLTIHELKSLKPVIVPVPQGVKREIQKWVHLRRMISTMSYSKGVGRNIKFYVKDEVTDKVLGLVELSSDYGCLGVRDSFVGWSHANRFSEKKLGHTAVGSTIVAVQPFGYNFLGGKLMSMLLTSKVVRDEWFNRYRQTLICMTTTSLYGNNGKETQYDGMKQWIRLGETTGETLIKPNQKIYEKWTSWLKSNYANEYRIAINSSGPKQKIIQLLLSKLGFKSHEFVHGYRRGVYFSKFFTNTFEFLKGDTLEVGEELFDSSVDSLVKSWRKRAIRRFKSLFKRNEVKSTSTFYSGVLKMTWEQTLYKYLGIKSKVSQLRLKIKAAKGINKKTIKKVLFNSFITSTAKPILKRLFTKVKGNDEVNFLFVNFRLIQTIYFKSFIRNYRNDVL